MGGADYHWGEAYTPADFLEKHSNAVIQCFTRRRLFRELLSSYADLHGLEGYVLLRAHGGLRKKKWAFSDFPGGGRGYLVHNFIDGLDGRCLAIFLDICHPRHAKVHAQKSIVIHPHGKVNLLALIKGQADLMIYVPGYGYLENSHGLKRAIGELKENVYD